MGFRIVKRYLGFEGSPIYGENNGEKKIEKGSTGAHYTRAQNFRVYLSKTTWTFGRLYVEIYRCGADPNRIRIELFFRSPPLQFPCIVISSACCHVPSPFLCAVELAAVVLYLTG